MKPTGLNQFDQVNMQKQLHRLGLMPRLCPWQVEILRATPFLANCDPGPWKKRDHSPLYQQGENVRAVRGKGP